MNRMILVVTICTFAMLGGGCATKGDMPLIFVQSNTAGISIGTSAVEQGADFVLGYKGSNFAVIPIAVVQADGNTEQIEASAGKGHTDALSVFGQFSVSSTTNAKSPRIGLGRFFATGQAAKKLADGYAKKLGSRKSVTGVPGSDCFTGKTNQSGDGETTAAKDDDESLNSADATSPGSTVKSSSSGNGPQKPKTSGTQSLVFAEHVTFGLVLSGSATESGGGLSLGYKDKDVAVIPAISRQRDGNGTQLLGETGGFYDALSVIGQFGADVKDDSGKLEVGLGKFFVTGLAAKRLSDGFAAKLCQDYTAPVK